MCCKVLLLEPIDLQLDDQMENQPSCEIVSDRTKLLGWPLWDCLPWDFVLYDNLIWNISRTIISGIIVFVSGITSKVRLAYFLVG